MFVLSNNEKKEKFIVTTAINTTSARSSFNYKQNPLCNSSTFNANGKNVFACQSSNLFHGNVQSTQSSTSQGSIMGMTTTSTIIPIPLKRRIRFHLSREMPSKETRKSKRPKEIKLKHRRGKEELYAIGRWKHDEHQRFVEALLKYGNDWKQVQKTVRTRSSTQARSHAQKFFVKIQKANILQFNLDLSKNSIKMLHDLVISLSHEEQKKMMKALNAIAFERKVTWNKNGRKQSLDPNPSMNNNNDHSETNEEDNAIAGNYGSAFHANNNNNNEGQGINMNDNEENYQGIINVAQMKKRRLSIEHEPIQHPVRKRVLGSINSLEGFFNPYIEEHERMVKRESFDEKDYINCFNCAFKNDDGNSCWRKMSQEEDYLINYMMTNAMIPGSDKK